MTGLNAKRLKQMRDQLLQLLPDTATLYEAQRVMDGAGGFSTTWVPVAGGTVPCRLDPLYYREQLSDAAGQAVLEANFVLTMPHDAPIAAHQRVEINGALYHVLTMADVHSWRVARRAYLIRYD